MNKTSVLILMLAIILSACSAVSIEVMDAVLSTSTVKPSSPSPTALPTIIPSPTASPTITPWPTETPTPIPEVIVSVLMGGDFDEARPERNMYGIRSDVFIIAIVDVYYYLQQSDPMKITLISIPRDLWVKVPCSTKETGYDRVNAAWAYGGFECVRETLELNFLPDFINYEIAPFAYVEFDGFIDLIDHMGGIDITPTITHSEWCGDYHGTDGATGRWIKWHAGQTYHMMGGQALCYARGRTHAEGDLDRNRRGLELLWAMVEQYPDQLFGDGKLVDVVTGFIDFWQYGMDLIQMEFNLDDVINYAKYVLDINHAEWRSVKFTLNEVEFWKEPQYGASVLRSKVDIPKWIYCKLYLEGMSFSDTFCTETFPLEE